MKLRNKLDSIKKKYSAFRNQKRAPVYFGEIDDENLMVIPELNFRGTIEEGRELKKKYPPKTLFIISEYK